MKKMLFAVVVVSMMTAACTKENSVQNEVVSDSEGICFVADFGDQVSTKTVLVPGEKSASVEWLAGDKVCIFATGGNYLYKASAAGKSTTLVPDGQQAGEAEVYYALYPYNETATVSGNVISTTLPAEQTGVKGSFTTHLAVASSTGTTMTFMNVCGLVKVNIASDNVTSIEFKGNNDEIVAGPVNITVSEGEPTYAPAEGSTATAVVMTPASGQVFEPGDYYFAVLPQNFTAGFTVTSYKNDGRKVVRTATKEGGIALNLAAVFRREQAGAVHVENAPGDGGGGQAAAAVEISAESGKGAVIGGKTDAEQLRAGQLRPQAAAGGIGETVALHPRKQQRVQPFGGGIFGGEIQLAPGNAADEQREIRHSGHVRCEVREWNGPGKLVFAAVHGGDDLIEEPEPLLQYRRAAAGIGLKEYAAEHDIAEDRHGLGASRAHERIIAVGKEGREHAPADLAQHPGADPGTDRVQLRAHAPADPAQQHRRFGALEIDHRTAFILKGREGVVLGPDRLLGDHADKIRHTGDHRTLGRRGQQRLKGFPA